MADTIYLQARKALAITELQVLRYHYGRHSTASTGLASAGIDWLDGTGALLTSGHQVLWAAAAPNAGDESADGQVTAPTGARQARAWVGYQGTGAAGSVWYDTPILKPVSEANDLKSGAVTGIKIAGGAVGTTQLALNAVDGTILAPNAVGAGHIQAGVVDNTKLGSGAALNNIGLLGIPGTYIANATLDNSKLGANFRAIEKVTTLPVSFTNYPQGAVVFLTTDNTMYRSTGTAWVKSIATTDLTGTITGAQIGANVVDSTKLATGTALANIGTGGVTATYIGANAVDNTKLAVGAALTNIGTGGVTATYIGSGAVTQAKIANGAVGVTQLAVSTSSGGPFPILDGTGLHQMGLLWGTYGGTSGANFFNISAPDFGAGGINILQIKAFNYANIIMGENGVAGTIGGDVRINADVGKAIRLYTDNFYWGIGGGTLSGGLRITQGTSFPASPATSDRCYRKDLHYWCYYDGTRWLTEEEFEVAAWTYYVAATVGAELNAAQEYMNTEMRDDYAYYLTRFRIRGYVNVTNNISNYWTVTLRTFTALVTQAVLSTAGWSGATWSNSSTTTFSAQPSVGDGLQLYVDRIGAPGAFRFYFKIYAKLVIT